MIAHLVLLNGPPGVGKSTIAQLLTDERPLALRLDIDELRTRLGRWQDDDHAKALARRLALVMAREHLDAGYDVIVPQLLGRPEFVVTLEELATDAGAVFTEVLLRVDEEVALQRFLDRRAELVAASEAHPQVEILEVHAAEVMASTVRSLDALAATRPNTIVVDASGSIAATHTAVVAALPAPGPASQPVP